MSILTIEIPDDRWMSSEYSVRPRNKQFCLVVFEYTQGDIPVICQWRHGNTNSIGMDAFVDVSDVIQNSEIAASADSIMYRHIPMGSVIFWRPIDFPKEFELYLSNKLDNIMKTCV